MSSARALALTALLSAVPASLRAQTCRILEVTFQPTSNLQIAVWIEDTSGHYIDTAFLTRSTGVFGLGNRPGHHLFKSDVRWPYGRRDMVLPVWAHRRNHPYGLVVMGGSRGNSIASCSTTGVGSECDDTTIGYHSWVSTSEPFYCSPSGGLVTHPPSGIDIVSCASPFTGSKGAYADAPAFSLYPPRADLAAFNTMRDSTDAMGFAAANDLVAISGATPQGGVPLATPIRWNAPAYGDYIVRIEASQEADPNLYHNYSPFLDPHVELRSFGQTNPFGQPSIVYVVPVTMDETPRVALTSTYEGYGDWDGASGTLHPPDVTISDTPGSGAGRLYELSDGDGNYRLKVRTTTSCSGLPPPDGGATAVVPDGGLPPGVSPGCIAPLEPTDLTITPSASSLRLRFKSAPTGVQTARFDVRYREAAPITDATFSTALPSSEQPPAPSSEGAEVSTLVSGLRPLVTYTVAVRAVADCGAASPVVTSEARTTAQNFTVLHGCFLATAAYGSPAARALDPLRAFRDRVLLSSTLGRIAVATYYSFSPPLARVIADNRVLARTVRAGLERLAP